MHRSYIRNLVDTEMVHLFSHTFRKVLKAVFTFRILFDISALFPSLEPN